MADGNVSTIPDSVTDVVRQMMARDDVARWRAESENASARLELAKHKQNISDLLAQHQPVDELGIDRDKLRLLLLFVLHGDMNRLKREMLPFLIP
jgi:hypothetical protein